MDKAEEEKEALRQQKKQDLQKYLRKFDEVKKKNQMIEQKLREYEANEKKASEEMAAF